LEGKGKSAVRGQPAGCQKGQQERNEKLNTHHIEVAKRKNQFQKKKTKLKEKRGENRHSQFRIGGMKRGGTGGRSSSDTMPERRGHPHQTERRGENGRCKKKGEGGSQCTPKCRVLPDSWKCTRR